MQLDALVDHQLHVVFPTYRSPEHVQHKLSAALGTRAIALTGGRSIGNDKPQEANMSVCIPWQPGLFKTIARTQPDVLIGDGFFQWTSVALLHRLLRQVPLVVCYERTFHTERKAQWYRNLYRRMVMRFVDACCVNGQQSVQYTHALGMPVARMATGFMAADTEGLAHQCDTVTTREKEALRYQWQAEGLIFLFIGQLIKRKGVHQLLNAWSRFERMSPGAGTLVMVGSGPEGDSLRQLTISLNLKSVRFLGQVDYDRIAPYYATADVFVMPTLEDNWSLVIPEAMACGLPVLTSYYNGCWPELIHPDVNGWVFDSFDVDGVVRCLAMCADKQNELAHMGQRSKEIVSHHTPAHAAQAILRACEIALSHRSAK
jgi:glycosyltransferase involved in cell wall biosynthesis